MTGTLDLQQRRIETLWVLDESGDMLTSNEPAESDRSRAPVFHLEWAEGSYGIVYRHDVADHLRSAIDRALVSSWPFPATGPMPILDDLLQSVSGTGDWYSGPVFVAVAGTQVPPDIVQVSRSNADLLQGDLADWQGSIELEQPMFARILDGMAVSLCATVRRSVSGVEAGVDTLQAHRRQGHGRAVVAAWSSAASGEGVTPFYSTSWTNDASIALANSLGYRQIGASLWVA